MFFYKRIIFHKKLFNLFRQKGYYIGTKVELSMALSTAIQNFRANRKIVQEKNNAAQTVQAPRSFSVRMLGIPFALGFAFLLMSLAGIAAPVQADMNFSWVVEIFESLFIAATNAMPSFEGFIDAGFPLLIKIGIYGAILGIIGLFVWAFRETIVKVLGMLGFGSKGK